MMKIRAAACVLLAFSSSIGYCIAQYQIRSMYSDDECFDLFAIRSYPVYYEGNGKDLGDDEDESTAAYNQCMEEVYGDDAVQSYYQNDNMNDNMNDNNKNNNNNNNNNKNNNNNLNGCRQIQNAKFAGAGALYESFDCAWTRSPLTNAPSVLISEYYGGCPADGNEPAVYTSVLQGCMPFYVLGSHQGNNNNNNNNNKKDKYFYRLECNEDGDVSTVRCSDSSCETCDIKTTYTQNKCYLLQDNFYATYQCRGYTVTNGESSEVIEINKGVFIGVVSAMGALVLGVGGYAGYNCAKAAGLGLGASIQGGQQESTVDYSRFL